MIKIYSFCDVCDGRVEYEAPGVDCSVEPSLTQQQFQEECDINRIMANYARSGVLPAGQFEREAVFGEATAHDLASAMNLVAQGASAFESLDPDARAAFGNDPVRFLAAFDDPVEHPRLEKFGFLVKKPVVPEMPGVDGGVLTPPVGNVPPV